MLNNKTIKPIKTVDLAAVTGGGTFPGWGAVEASMHGAPAQIPQRDGTTMLWRDGHALGPAGQVIGGTGNDPRFAPGWAAPAAH
jgi:hypothetical protein